MTRMLFAALKASDLPEQYKTYLNGIADDVASMSTAMSNVAVVADFNKALQSLPFENLKNLSFDAAYGLIQFAGGMEALGANLGTYYTNFYREDEQRAQAIKNIDSATGGGLEPLLKSLADGTRPAQELRDSFRAIVEEQDLTTEAGQRTYAALIGVSGAFAELNPIVVQTAVQTAMSAKEYAAALKDVDDAQANVTDSLRAISDYGQSLSDTINELRGQAVANRDAAVSAFTQALTAAESYYTGLLNQQKQINTDINALRGQVGKDLADAAAIAQASLRSISDANSQAQNALQGALQGVVSAITQAANNITAAQAGVEGAKTAITTGYLSANDKLVAAQRALTDAQLALTDAQTQSADRLKGAANDLFDVLRGMKGLNAVGDYTSQKNAFEAIAAKALAGDADAIGKLGAAGGSYLSASEAGASTAAQYQRDDIRIRQVLGQVAGKFGGVVSTGQTGTTETDTDQLAKNLADATIEMARWTSAVEVSGASRTLEQTDLLAEYNDALAALTDAQDSQAALLAATGTLDLSGIQQDTYDWSGAVRDAIDAQTTSTAAAADFATAMSAASASGVALVSMLTPLQALEVALTSLAAAQLDYDAVQGNLYIAAAGVVDQYTMLNDDLASVSTTLSTSRADIDASSAAFSALGLTVPVVGAELSNLATALAAVSAAQADYTGMLASSLAVPATLVQQYADASAALTDFATRTNAIDFSAVAVLDPLGDLLQTYADAVVTLLGAQAGVQESYFSLYDDVAASYAQNSYGMTKDEFAAYHYANFGINEQRVNPNLLKPIGLAIGTNYVPYDGFSATLHEGEAVVPKAYNPAAGGQSQNNELVAEIRALRAELSALRSDNRAADAAIENNTRRTAKVLERAMTSADSINVTVLA
jgi:hypothetical protein